MTVVVCSSAVTTFSVWWTTEQARALCTVLDWNTLSKTSLGWARRGTPAWIWSMWAQGLATSLYTHRPRQKKKEREGGEGTQRWCGIKRDIQTRSESEREVKHFDNRNKLTSYIYMLSFSSNVWHACVCSEGGKESTIGPKWETQASVPGECCTYSKQSVKAYHVRGLETEMGGPPLNKILMCVTRLFGWDGQCSCSNSDPFVIPQSLRSRANRLKNE